MATAPRAVSKKVEPEASPQQPAAPVKSKKNLVLILITFLILAAAGGGAAWFFLAKPADPNAPQAKPTLPSTPPVFMVFDPFTVNLQPQGAGDQYLQIAFSIQVQDQKEADSIKLYMPHVRSRLLLLLSGKKASDISTVEGKKALAEEITAQINQPFVPDGPAQNVLNVFFTSFVIQ